MGQRKTKGKLETDELASDSAPPTSSGGGTLSGLSFSSDPGFTNIFDDSVLELFSIFTNASASRVIRDANQLPGLESYASMNRPILFDDTNGIQPVSYRFDQTSVVDTALLGEVIYNELERTITTPGDISMADLKQAVAEYIARAADLIAGWASTAALYGLVNTHPQATGQLKNYLALIGAKPWQHESKVSLIQTLPLPANLVTYLTQFYAVKQVPDGRNMFCVPTQPAGLTPDEGTNSGRDLKTFEAKYKEIQTMTDTTGADVYPEVRRMLMNAGWRTFPFPSEIGVVRDGQWWDQQVVNMPFAALQDQQNPTNVQCSPQAGQKRRTYALSVYSDSMAPYIDRLLQPVYMCGQDTLHIYDRSNGTFNCATVGMTNDTLGPVSLGSYNMRYSLNVAPTGVFVPGFQPAFLVIGQSDTTAEVGWAGSIVGHVANAALTPLYSEMANILMTDEGSGRIPGDETLLYRKIFRGESTTVASNKYKFGNTVDPNMVGAYLDPVIGTVIPGDRASLQRVYQAFMKTG